MSTTDPGMEDGLKSAANDVESDPNDDELGTDEEEGEQNYLEPTRWWFASTACPLLAGTFGPIASAFNICALVYNWRVYIPDQGTEEHGLIIKDPAWLIAINALSLVSALVANAFLLLNMARRVRFSVAQPITISGFLTAGVLLICDMAALTASPTYRITDPKAEDPVHHALSSAFYYAIFAAMDYLLIGLLMCVTVYGANRGYYKKDFQLTPSQRTLMLQTMSFMTYLLLGALVFSKIEGWEFLDAVYWANVTLLTVGTGDFSPSTDLGKGLLFPFAIGGILIVGLVVGSIRTLVLERGKEKLSARITEKHRSKAINHVDQQHQSIKIGIFAKADFPSDPSTPIAQRRREEFNVMRKVQSLAESQRRYMALAMSASIALFLWLGGAAIFMTTEKNQQWTYLNALYFSFISLLTIGYGDFVLLSNSGKPFFVLWSLLAVPSLTILISNMGDTIVKWVTDLTDWVGRVTVLPDEEGFRSTAKMILKQVRNFSFTPPGIFGDIPKGQGNKQDGLMHETNLEARMLDRLADRLSSHLDEQDLGEPDPTTANDSDALQRDTHFYHYVLSRECRNVQKDLSSNPPKQYGWADWEYFLKLMGNAEEAERASFEKYNKLVPDALLVPSSKEGLRSDSKSQPPGTATTQKHRLHRKPKPDSWMQDWSWLSPASPLMSAKSESEWILERLSAALERELNMQRRGQKQKPPISYSELRRHAKGGGKGGRREGEVEREFLEGEESRSSS